MLRVIILSLFSLLISDVKQNVFSGESTINFSAIPVMNNFVNDLQGVLSIEQEYGLNKKLEALKNGSGAEFVILVIKSTFGEKLSHYTFRAMDAWDQDHDGRSIAVFMTINAEDASFFIGTRPTIQHVLPDAIVQRICDKTIGPHWRSSEWFQGINAGVEELIDILEHEDIINGPITKKIQLTEGDWIILGLLLMGLIYTLIYFVRSDDSE